MNVRNAARIGRWATATAFVAVCATGCTGGSAETGAPLRLPPENQVSSAALPLDEYSPTPAEQKRSDHAQAALERACVTGFGVRWAGPSETDLTVGSAMIAARRADRFGLVDPEQAGRYGYHPPPWSTDAVGAAQQAAGDHDTPPDTVADVLFGRVPTVRGRTVPSGGCRGEASRQLSAGADVRSGSSVVSRLEQEATTRAGADPRVKALLNAWRSCMERAGYHYPNPASAARDKRWQARKLTNTELATARTDVRCKTDIGYLATMTAVTAEHQRALIAEHADELGRVKRSFATRARNAAAALAAPPPS
jgi:hypothetical protein